VSLIILNVTFQSEAHTDGTVSVEREAINAIYREAAEGESRGLLKFSEEQNVSADMLGEDGAAATLEDISSGDGPFADRARRHLADRRARSTASREGSRATHAGLAASPLTSATIRPGSATDG